MEEVPNYGISGRVINGVDIQRYRIASTVLIISMNYVSFILKTHLRDTVLRKSFQEWFLRINKASKPCLLMIICFPLKNGRF